MTVVLRDYQAQIEEGVYAKWRHGFRNVLAVAPTASGKTTIFSSILGKHRGASVAIAHRQELVSQISLALARVGVRHGLIAPDSVIRNCVRIQMQALGYSAYSANAQCRVAGVDTLVRRDAADPFFQSVTLWVQDECFLAGTLIDGKPIETVQVGDLVTAFDESTGRLQLRKVVRLFRNPAPKNMVRVSAGHHVVECTREHPFFTRRGWVPAAKLRTSDELLLLRAGSSSQSCFDELLPTDRQGVLQQDLFGSVPSEAIFRNNGLDEPEVRQSAHESQQPDATPRCAREGVFDSSSDQASTFSARGQWPPTHGARSVADCDVRGARVHPAVLSEDRLSSRQWGVPASLQIGSRESCDQAGDRDRRGQPWCASSEGAGSKEGSLLTWARVDSIEILESAGARRSGTGGNDGYVFNLEVEGLHTYIANGFVVHNCHHVLAANKWGKAADLFPNALGLGVTATPIRADGKGLGRHAHGIMDTMVLGPSMRDLINRKYLTDYRIFVPPSNLDLSKVPVAAGGDYSPEPLRAAVHKSRIVGDVVQHYLRIAKGKLGVTFAVDIESAQELAAAYRAAGVPAEVVTSETPDLARQAILTQFANRQILQLVNVDIFGEGFDLPAIEVVSFARPTLSYALYVQQFGRALRLLTGKEWAIIIDHVGNVHKHGLPDTHREWTLDARMPGRGPSPADAMPIKTCPQCESAYEAVLGQCPYCNHIALPVGRSKPAEVQGDLYELSPEALAELRGEIERVDGAVVLPWGQPASVGRAVMHRHQERQASQKVLRDIIAYWGGARDRALNTRRAQVEFFQKFGVDVMTAQTLGLREATELTARILKDL
jgi:superfamily II DNA or RNA helicase